MRAFSGSLVDMKGLIQKQRLEKDALLEQFAYMDSSLTVVSDQIRDAESLIGNSRISSQQG
jgi:hypothetical protein